MEQLLLFFYVMLALIPFSSGENDSWTDDRTPPISVSCRTKAHMFVPMLRINAGNTASTLYLVLYSDIPSALLSEWDVKAP